MPRTKAPKPELTGAVDFLNRLLQTVGPIKTERVSSSPGWRWHRRDYRLVATDDGPKHMIDKTGDQGERLDLGHGPVGLWSEWHCNHMISKLAAWPHCPEVAKAMIALWRV